MTDAIERLRQARYDGTFDEVRHCGPSDEPCPENEGWGCTGHRVYDEEAVWSALLDVAAASERLQALKDGPRDENYEAAKPAAWNDLRAALDRLNETGGAS